MEEPVVRASPARPPRRKRSTLCTLCTVIGLLASCAFVYFIVEAALHLKKNVNTLHNDMMHVDPKLIAAAGDPWSVAQPLLEKDTRYSVRATVWMEVTQHLEQGLSLPSSPNSRLLSYTVADVNRSELILFDDIVVRNITMRAQAGAMLPLDIPVEPLYTQDLGPSSLRVAFTVVPGSNALRDLGQLASISSIFRGSRQMLPRTAESERLQPGHDFAKADSSVMTSIESAMDQNGASVPLLALLPAGVVHNSSTGNEGVGECGRLIPPMLPFLDNAWRNRHFVKRVHNDTRGNRLYLDEGCQVHLPHVRSRVNLVMLKDYRSFHHAGYLGSQMTVMNQEMGCHQASPNSEFSQINLGSICANVREHGPLELLLTFNGTEDSPPSAQYHRYAPSLRIPQNAGNLRHHLTLPRSRPSRHEAPTVPAKGPCSVPHIELSPNEDYFHADIEVQISAHQALRSNVGEQFNIFSQPSQPDSLPLDDGQELSLNSSLEMDVLWEAKTTLLGDRIHANYRPAMTLIPLFDFATPVIASLLDVLYWSSRTTTAGLATTAQWMGLLSIVLTLLVSVDGIIKNPSSFSILIFIVLVPGDLFRIWYQGSVLLRLAPSRSRWSLSRRPMWKTEVKSLAAEKQSLVLGKVRAPALLAVLFAGYQYFLEPHNLRVREQQGCFSDPEQQDSAMTLSAFLSLASASLAGAATVVQIFFNTMSPASSIGRRGTFAGQLKWTVYLEFFSAYGATAVHQIERIGGWSSRRYALSLMDIERLLFLAVSAFQALRYPAVVQPVPGSGERAATSADEDNVPLLAR